MILRTIEHKEFHPNGQVWITGQIGIVASMWKHLYDYRTVNVEGKPVGTWCRLGKWTKQFDNGQLAWSIQYDEYGRTTNDKFPQFRKDGTPIVY